MDQVAAAMRQLFDLLVNRASSEQLAHVAVVARAQGADQTELDEIERAVERALLLHRTFAEHERRQTELAALFDTAGDLAGLRDLNAVLRSIVHRARMLLGADIAYLSLNDEEVGGTYMRVTDGSISARFQQIRLGMGEGLGGLVAQTARPYSTVSYLSDTRFMHTREIDAAVGDEGLVAILGVPLSLKEQVIGVLYAAYRSAREFTPDEVTLLSSLADHAAIAIDTARLLDETRTALDELNAAHRIIRAHNEAMRRAEQAHDRLTDLVLHGADVPEVAAAVAAVLGGGILVHDADGNELACIEATSAPAPPAAIAASRSMGRAIRQGDRWVCAVSAGYTMLGSLVLVGRAELPDADRRLFERAGVVTSLLLLQQRSVAEAENKVRGEIIVDLLTAPDRDPSGVVARARQIGIDLTENHALLVVHAHSVPREQLTSTVSRYARAARGVAGALENQVMLLPQAEPDKSAREVAHQLTKELGCLVTVGAAGPSAGPEALAAAYSEATRCLNALLALGRQGDGAAMPDLGFIGVLLGDRADTAGYVRKVLGPVLDYDAQRGTNLIGTLRAYFSSGTSLNRTKEMLHVHVNTVAQRLERVRSLLGNDWQQPERVLEVQLALQLHRITG